MSPNAQYTINDCFFVEYLDSVLLWSPEEARLLPCASFFREFMNYWLFLCNKTTLMYHGLHGYHALFWSWIAELPVWFRLSLADLMQFLGNISLPLLPPSSSSLPSLLPDQCYGRHVTCHTTDVCHVLTGRSWGTTGEEGQEIILKRLTASVNGLDAHDVPLGQCCTAQCVFLLLVLQENMTVIF